MFLTIISDELDPALDAALDGCERLGLHGVELRTLDGRGWAELTDDEVDGAIARARGRGLETVALATPVLKCSLPGAPAPAGALHGSRADATLEDSWALLDRVLPLAARNDVPFVRLFSGWRVADPAVVLDQVAELMVEAQRRAEGFPVEVLLENEHDCNVATADETSVLLERTPGLRVIWDPANHVRAGGDPAASALDGAVERIAHLHLKDVDAGGRWVPLGTGRVPYGDVVPRLLSAGYGGAFSLETHCQVDGSAERASRTALEHLAQVTPSAT
jgi:sugar phosphate isomerase/epimerase